MITEPLFRIVKVHGRTRDYYCLEQRGLLWGWNRIYAFETVEECEKEVKALLRERIPDEVVKEIYTDINNI